MLLLTIPQTLWSSGSAVLEACHKSSPLPDHHLTIEYLSPMAKSERTAVVLVAAGRGLRAAAGGPKQYRSVGGQPVIFRAMESFSRHPDVLAVQPVVNPDDSAMFTAAVAGLRHESPTNGGATRQASVL